jgi:flagellar biosynthesis/type III secretory pathway protein FliH
MEAAMPKKTKQRKFDQVNHFEQEQHPVDVAIARRPEVRALREQLSEESKRFAKALGSGRLRAWLAFEEKWLAYYGTREELMFDQGYEHGFATGRAEGMKSAPEARRLAALLRDLAIQDGCPREKALAALLEAAWSLVTRGKPARKR